MNPWKIIGWFLVIVIVVPFVGCVGLMSYGYNKRYEEQASGRTPLTQNAPNEPEESEEQASLRVSNLTCNKTPGGMIKIEAQLTNTGTKTLTMVNGHASFLRNGTLIDNGDGYADMLPMRPGDTSPITILGPVRDAADQCQLQGFTERHSQRIDYTES